MGVLCSLLVVLALLTCIGHAIWVMMAALCRFVFRGLQELLGGQRASTDSWQKDLQATHHHLARLLHRGWMDRQEHGALVEQLVQFEQRVRSGRTDARPASEGAGESEREPAPVYDAILVEPPTPSAPTATPATPEPSAPSATSPSPSPAQPSGSRYSLDRQHATPAGRPSRASRTLADVMQSFMAQRNIRWGELVSGLLIVGSAVGLVISLRATLSDTIPYFPALIFLMITLAIYGAGMYTLRRWNLQATSRGVLIIAMLLTPLNFVAAIVLSGPDQRSVTDPWYLAAVALGLVVCGGITFSGGRALIGAGWWRLTVAVLATSAGQLIVDRQSSVPLTATGTGLLLAVPLIGYLVAVLSQVLQAATWPRLSTRRAQQIFLVLGIATFSFLPPIALLLSHAPALREAAANLSPVLSLMAVAILASGLLVHRRVESRALAMVRTSGTALAVAGGMLMLAALVLAWPRPNLLILVGTLNFAILTPLAVAGRLPALHVPAIGCAALAGLIGFHVWQANLTWTGPQTVQHVTGWLLAGRSGLVLLTFSILAVLAGVGWERQGRRSDNLACLASAGALSILSLLIAFWDGFGGGRDLALTTPIFAFYAIISLLATWAIGRWRIIASLEIERALAWTATGLWFAALLHAVWQNPIGIGWLTAWQIQPYRPWTHALVVHSLTVALTAFGLALPEIRQTVRQRWDRSWQTVIPILTASSLGTSLIAASGVLPVRDFAFVPSAIDLALVSVAWLVAAAIYRRPAAWAVFQAIASLALIYAVAGWDPSRWPIRDNVGWAQFLQLQTIVLGLWCLGWCLVRRAVRRQEAVATLLRSGWPPETPMDQWLLGALTWIATALGVAVVWPGLMWEVFGGVTEPILVAGGQTWMAVAIVAVAWGVWLLDRASLPALLGLLLIAAAGTLLLTAGAPVEAMASAWRWWSAGYVLVTALILWCRSPIHERLSRFEWLGPWEFPATAASVARGAALVLGAGPILAITTAVAIRSAASMSVGDVPGDSFFARIGMTASYAIPLVVLVAVLLGHALRERYSPFALAGSVILQYAVSLAFLLQASPEEPGFLIGLLQWNLAGLGGYSLAWLALRPWIVAAERPGDDGWLDVQVHVTVGLLGVLGIGAAISVVVEPGQLDPWAQPLARPLMFVGWFAACVAAVWYTGTGQPSTVVPRLRTLAACGWLLVALIAAAVDPLDTLRDWLAYHVLTVGGLLLTATVTVAWLRYPALIREAAGSSALVLALGLRGGWSNPHEWAPWWSVAACGAVAVLWAAFSLRCRRQLWGYGAALAAVAATTIYWVGPFQERWQRDVPQAIFELMVADLMALLVAAAVWLGVELWWQRRGRSTGLEPAFRGPRLHVVASILPLVCFSSLSFFAATLNSVNSLVREVPVIDLIGGGGGWAAAGILGVTAAALWDDRARHAIGGLFVGGLMLAVLIIDALGLTPDRLHVTLLVVVATYVMLAGWLWRWSGPLVTWGEVLGIRDPEVGQRRTEEWLPSVSVLLALWVSLAALIVVSLFADRPLRYWAASVPAFFAIGIAAWSHPHRRQRMGLLSLLMAGLAVILVAWADLTPHRWDSIGLLLRSFRLLMALSVLTFVHGVLLPWCLNRRSAWQSDIRRAAVIYGCAGVFALLGVLALELVVFPFGSPLIPAAQVVAVTVVLVALIAGLIALALQTGGTLSTWSESQRMGCVFAAELTGALLFVHLYLCRPEWFGGFLLPYWPYVVMAIAFAGVTVGHLCQRSGLRVLSEPLVGTGAFLPLLPALGYWVVVAEATSYSGLLLVVGAMYVLLSLLRRSAASMAAAVIAGNGALWAMLFDHGFLLWQRPQFWLIPPAVSVLIAAQLNRHRLTDAQLTALRYASVLVVYVSSTGEMFLRGIGSSLWPPMILASLSVAGVLLGMALRIRAFLYLGTSFVLLSVISMVWHAAQAIQHSWPWWAFGIGLGMAILTMFAVFEKQRVEILRWIETMKQWDP
ncbi:MAG: hypothetical protein EA424_10345 [Planctomycetaceae bacterium]|nr:MAG: hypothetical protein EA424_10345 [Planctomycetaceae bacterium]